MLPSSLISHATWRRVVLGAGAGVVFAVVLAAFLFLTGVMSAAPGTLPAAPLLLQSLDRACEQLVPWLMLWLIVIPALQRIPVAQPWLALAGYAAFALAFIPMTANVTIVSAWQYASIFVFALVTGLPIIRANDVWLSAAFLAALHIVTVAFVGMPFGSTNGYGVFDARLGGDVVLTGGRMGPVFGMFGILGMLWMAGSLLQHQRAIFASATKTISSRRDALNDFALGLVISGAAVSLMFVAMLATHQSRVVMLKPALNPLTMSLTAALPAAVSFAFVSAYVLIGAAAPIVRRLWIAAALAVIAAVAWHMTQPGTTIHTAASVGAMTLATSAAYVLTGRLWMPIALYFGWLLFEGPIFGFPSGGLTVANAWFRQDVLQYTVWSGGVHGPDASLFGIIAKFIMAGAVIAFARKDSK